VNKFDGSFTADPQESNVRYMMQFYPEQGYPFGPNCYAMPMGGMHYAP